MASVLFCLVMIFTDGKRAGAAGGGPDTSFNPGGAVANDEAFTAAAQPNGKVITGGAFNGYNGDNPAGDGVAPVLPATGELAFSSASQSVDETAGNATITLTRTGGTDNQVVAKVTLADVTTTPADYGSPGTLDKTFNQGGTGVNNAVYSTALQPDGKIVIVGFFTTYNDATRSVVARINSNGSLDASFDPGAGGNAITATVALQSDGKVIIGGYFTFFDGITRSHIARLNSDGSLDTSFDPGTGANSTVYSTAVQSDGKIIIGGNFTTYNGVARNFIARLNSDGSLDTSFNLGANGTVNTIAVQPDGKIIIGGNFTTYDGTSRNRIARLNSDGSLDTTFDPGTGANNPVLATALESDGKIIIAGAFTTYNGTARNRAARLNTDGTLDTSFNPGTGADDWVRTVALQPDGKIILGGDFTVYDGTSRNHIARLNSDSSLDASFDPGTGMDQRLRTIAVQPDGKIILGGDFNSYNGTPRNFIVRVLGDIFVTWADGDSSDKTVQLLIVKDSINEVPDETLNLAMSVISGGATLGSPSTATLTILDPNHAPLNIVPVAQSTNEDTALVFSLANSNRISISDVDAGTSPVQVTLTATNGPVTLNGTGGLSFITGDGTSDATMSFTGTITAINTALDGLSFNPTTGYSGAASLQIVTNDQGNTGTGSARSDTDTINIKVNEGGTLKFSTATYSVNEATATMTINVARTGGRGGAAAVEYSTSDGTATGYTSCAAGRDYLTKTGTLSWADGDMTNKTFTIPICNDAVFDGNETVNLTLSNVTGSASLGTPATAALTIMDDEAQPRLSINNVTLTEGNAVTVNANFSVKLSVASTQTVTVKYATANGTAQAGADYTAVPLRVLTFTPGQTSKTVAVAVTADLLDEVNETFKVMLSAPTNSTIAAGLGTGTCTINDNDLPPTLKVNSLTITEGNTTTSATFTVNLSAPSGQTVTVKYATANGTALAPADYTAKALTTLTFLPGQITKTVSVAVIGDLLDEATENFKLVLSSPTNATIAAGTGVCTITDNDPTPSLTINNMTVTETDVGTVSATFTVKLSAASGQTVTVKYATANGTAVAAGDYTAIGLTTLAFTPGQTSKPVTVLVKGETVFEGNESFFVNLSGAVNASIADAQGLGAIINDD